MNHTIKCDWCSTPITTIDHIITLCALHLYGSHPTDRDILDLKNYVYDQLNDLETPQDTNCSECGVDLKTWQGLHERSCSRAGTALPQIRKSPKEALCS